MVFSQLVTDGGTDPCDTNRILLIADKASSQKSKWGDFFDIAVRRRFPSIGVTEEPLTVSKILSNSNKKSAVSHYVLGVPSSSGIINNTIIHMCKTSCYKTSATVTVTDG